VRVLVIAPQGTQDVIGLVTALEGQPLPSGDIAGRLAGFAGIAGMEASTEPTDAELIDVLLASKHDRHNNYQAFLDAGGRIGLQQVGPRSGRPG
jgi:hypothetical protein